MKKKETARVGDPVDYDDDGDDPAEWKVYLAPQRVPKTRGIAMIGKPFRHEDTKQLPSGLRRGR